MSLFSKFKRIFILISLFIIYTCICAFSYTNAVFSNISNNVFRLHVIAASDSEDDQSLKYIVRDSVLDYVDKITNNLKSKEEIIKTVSNNTDEIKKIAEETIRLNGYNYTVEVEVGNFNFPTKTYGDISFPSGNYDALRIKIGEAKGQNWWCVMFPPLCFVDVSSGVLSEDSKKVLEEELTEEEYNLVSNEDYKVKFKIVEFLQTIGTKIAVVKN